MSTNVWLFSACFSLQGKQSRTVFFSMNNPLKILSSSWVCRMLCIYPDFNILRRPLLSLCSVACPGILAFLPINETDTGQTLDISLLIWNFASKTLGNFSKVKELHSHLIWFIWPIWNYLILLNLEIDKNLYEVFFWQVKVYSTVFFLQYFITIFVLSIS